MILKLIVCFTNNYPNIFNTKDNYLTLFKCKVNEHKVLIVQTKYFTHDKYALLFDQILECNKLNILLIDSYDKLDLILNENGNKIGKMVVNNKSEWEKFRLKLSFCPKVLYLIDENEIDFGKFIYDNKI